MRRGLLLALSLLATFVACETSLEPHFGVPEPTPFVVSTAISVNECEQISAIDGKKVQVADIAPFVVGQRVLLHVIVEGDLAPDVDSVTALSLDTSGYAVGRYVLTYVTSAIPASGQVEVSVDATLFAPPRVAQICTVPVYSTLEVTSNGSIHAEPWDGTSGGIVAVEVLGELKLNGALVATSAGFAGGIPNTDGGAADGANCTDPEAPDVLGSGRGGGIGGRGLTSTGRARIANAGGGGNCHNSGGGGGGNGGYGGRGGHQLSFNSPNLTWGVGGKRLTSGSALLLFGGGGGAGHHNNNAPGGGGAGGGAVLLRADRLSGDGVVVVNGGRGGDAGTGADCEGAGGGGAAGSVVADLEVITGHSVTIVGLGGDGGWVDNNGTNYCGPGGGGGGGRLTPGTAFQNQELDGGLRGRNRTTQEPHGAQDGSDGAS